VVTDFQSQKVARIPPVHIAKLFAVLTDTGCAHAKVQLENPMEFPKMDDWKPHSGCDVSSLMTAGRPPRQPQLLLLVITAAIAINTRYTIRKRVRRTIEDDREFSAALGQLASVLTSSN
jgi:hypothetical protein